VNYLLTVPNSVTCRFNRQQLFSYMSL